MENQTNVISDLWKIQAEIKFMFKIFYFPCNLLSENISNKIIGECRYALSPPPSPLHFSQNKCMIDTVRFMIEIVEDWGIWTSKETFLNVTK